MTEYEIFIMSDGTIKFIYYDELNDLLKSGVSAVIKRVSHVDPRMTKSGVRWFVDLSPVDSPLVLGPFKTREKAITAEINWIQKNINMVVDKIQKASKN